ncbi:hypothetical protein GIB67_023099, partial [Kingdonia uniflora]
VGGTCGCTDASGEVELQIATRAYILHLIGSLLYSDKSNTKIHMKFILLLKDIPKIKNYAWGGALLVHLFRQLGVAAK